jgi:predicted dehydrogenase
MKGKIGVGIIGIDLGRGWASTAHVPALRALPEFDIVAVSTRRRATAEAAAQAFGIPNAFDNHSELVKHPDVDVVVVTVKVPHHLELVSAAISAGKHVYCEWPLGNGLDEAANMAEQVRRAGVRAVVGLQARMAPVVHYVHALVREGYVGEVLSTTLVGSAMNWAAQVDPATAYIADKANGATMLSIPIGHTVDALCHCLGEFQSLSATMAIRQPFMTRSDTGERLLKTAHDQVAISGVLENGAVASVHYRSGVSRGVKFLWEINGTKGDLQVTAAGGHGQMSDLSLAGACGNDRALRPMLVPPEHRWVSAELSGPAVNVAQVYARFADDLRDGSHQCPDVEDALRRHRMIAAIEESADSGRRLSLASSV